MSQVIEGGAKSPQELEQLKNFTLAVYILQALSVFWGLTAVVGVIINYVKREDAIGTLYESHFNWQIRTFWFGLLWGFVGFILIFAFGLGFVILTVDWIWMIYRVVKGWIKLNEGKTVYTAP